MENLIVAYAGAAGQLVADGRGAHSPYTGLLLEELEGEGQPVEAESVLFRIARMWS